MRVVIAALTLLLATACGPRQVEVRTAPSQSENAPTIHFTNNLPQPVNVYVTTGGNDLFVGQVSANTTSDLVVRGVTSGSSVALKAVTMDAARTYTPPNRSVILEGRYNWTIP